MNTHSSFRYACQSFQLLLAIVFLPLLASAQPGYVRGHVMVKFKEGVSEARSSSVLKARKVRRLNRISQLKLDMVSVPEGVDERDFVQALRAQRDVEFAELDEILPHQSIVPNDTFFVNEWYLTLTQVPAAWSYSTGLSSITVALIDTGVYFHLDLVAKMIPGWNVFDNNSNTQDVSGRGTWAAGVVAPSANNGGVVGVCWGCMLMPVRVSDQSGNASAANIASGIIWAADHGAKIANLGYAVTASSVVQSAAQYLWNKGGLTVAPSGNNGSFDSSVDSPFIVTVAGVDAQTGKIWSFSNTGNNVDLSAPNFSTYTTWAGGGFGPDNSGTCISAAIVSGVAALVWSMNPSLTPAQVTNILEQSAVQKLGSQGTWNSTYGWGVVNALKAVTMAAGGASGGSTKGATTTTVASSTNPSTQAQAIVLTATVSPASASGTVTFMDGTVTLGTGTLTAGLATFSTSNLSVGSHSISGVYSGDSANNGSTSTTMVQTVLAAAPSAPTLLSAVAKSATEVDLAWSASSGSVAGYQITRNGAVLTSVSSSTLTFADTTVSASTAYTYSLKAYTSGGSYSSSSNSIQVTTPAGSSGGSTSEEATFLTLLNAYRATNGAGPVSLNTTLQNSSLWMSNDMATNNYISHTDSLGRTFAQRMTAFGWTGTAGENIAGGYATAQQVFDGWKTACDPDASNNCTYAHNANMLNPAWNSVGVARSFSYLSTYGYYWTTDFGASGQSTALPTVTFSATPTSISAGQSATLSWSVSGATSISIDNGVGFVSSSGSKAVSPAQSTTFSLTATNSNGSTVKQVTITVIPPDTTPPSAPVLSGNKPSASQVALTWTVSTDPSTSGNATGVAGYQIIRNNSVLTSVSASTWSYTDSALTSSTTYLYVVRAYDGAGNYSAASNAYQVTTPASVSLPIISSFTASPSAITTGQATTLAWTVSNATSLTIDNAVGVVTGTTSRSVAPSQSITFTLTASNSAGSVTRSVAVTVTSQQTSTLPQIASINPASITPVQNGMTLLVISGQNFGANFQLNNVIRIGPYSFTSNYSQDGSHINAYLPLYVVPGGTYSLTISNNNGTSMPYTVTIVK